MHVCACVCVSMFQGKQNLEYPANGIYNRSAFE